MVLTILTLAFHYECFEPIISFAEPVYSPLRSPLGGSLFPLAHAPLFAPNVRSLPIVVLVFFLRFLSTPNIWEELPEAGDLSLFFVLVEAIRPSP